MRPLNWTAIIPFICDLAYIFNKNCSASCTYQSRKVQCFSDLSILLRLIYFDNIVPIAAVLRFTSTNVPTHNPMPFFQLKYGYPLFLQSRRVRQTFSPIPSTPPFTHLAVVYEPAYHQIQLSFCLISCTSQRQYRHHAPYSVRHQCLARDPLDGWIWSHR